MSRQGSGPSRGRYGRAGDAAYADGHAYQRDAYLEADAYPVDPGYQAYANGGERERPRPADMPPGPPRTTRADRGMPPRPGYARRTGSQAPYDPGSADRPWQRPEDAMPGVGRPRPRPGGPRPRPAGPGAGPGPQRPAPPRGPRPAGPYDPNGPGPYAYAPGPGPAATHADPVAEPPGPGYAAHGRPGYPGQGNQGYQQAQGYQGQDFRAHAQAQGRPGQAGNGRAPGFQGEPGWAGPGAGPVPPGGQGPFAAEQPWAGQYGPGWDGGGQGPRPGAGGGAPGQGQPWPQGQPGYGQQDPGPGAAGYGQGQFAAGQPFAAGAYGQGQPPAGQYGEAPYAGDPRGAGQYGRPAMDGQSGQSMWNAGPQQEPGWGPGQGPNARATGSWRAAGPAQGDWGGQQPPYGPGVRATGSWQAAAPGYGGDPRSAGSWPGAGPEQGRNWAPEPGGGGPGHPNAGSWEAAAPPQEPGWAPGQGQFGPGQYGAAQSGQGARNTGSWQATGAVPGQERGGPGPQPYPGQPYPGQPYPGQPYPGQGHPSQPQSGQPYPGAGSAGLRNTGGFSRAGSPIIRQRDSALPDQPPGGRGPIAAIETDNVAAFARDLRVLRSKAGLDYPDMAEKSHYTMRTLASAAGGLRLPTLPVLIAYVNACGGDIGEWEERWGKLSKSGKRLPTALAAGDGQPGPVPQNPRQTGEIYVITSAKQRDW